MDARDLVDLTLQVGMVDPSQITVAVAIALAESGGDPNAVGDESLVGEPTPDGRHWGPSIGLWQIRSIQEAAGTGLPRDPTRLRDPLYNTRSMLVISNNGSDWSPWSVYTSGVYREHLDDARRALGSGGVVEDAFRDVAETGTEGFLETLIGQIPGLRGLQWAATNVDRIAYGAIAIFLVIAVVSILGGRAVLEGAAEIVGSKLKGLTAAAEVVE